jgi:hypothetical protein
VSKKKIIFLLLLLSGLGGLSLYLNRDRFASKSIQISHRVSPWLKIKRAGGRAARLGEPVAFTLNGYYRLTGVKVVPLAGISTNKYAHPVWHLVSDSNSVPTSSFVYGGPIRGMRPAVKGARPDPLDPAATYRLIVTTPDKEAQHDFRLTAQ